MSQLSFSEAEYAGKRKQTRREKFLSEMDRTIPWDYLAGEIAKHYPRSGKVGRQPYPIETMIRIHFMQQWFNLSDPAMEEVLYDINSMRQFARLPAGRVPDETTILNFRHLLEEHDIADGIFEGVTLFLQDYGLMVRQGTIVDATIIDAPSSTKNEAGARDPEMHQTKKGKDWRFGMKAHIGVDLHTGLVHTVVGTAANVADVTQVAGLLHGHEQLVLGDAGYQGVDKRDEHQGREVQWFIAMRPSKIAQMKRGLVQAQVKFEHMKASLRAKVEHPFRVIKRQFGFTKVRYRGLSKNTAQLKTLFALANLWMARGRLMTAMGQVRP
ncbi:IS5 family transposase [Bordetella sp. FB-8]|uniref:IS5 family transposase n=1 Tax=Bordetella sp. FB-8 TaxID=1159870 RepID=UPI00036DE8A2|nr:IS5 family transposase [Bordetella sp. FB-8]